VTSSRALDSQKIAPEKDKERHGPTPKNRGGRAVKFFVSEAGLHFVWRLARLNLADGKKDLEKK